MRAFVCLLVRNALLPSKIPSLSPTPFYGLQIIFLFQLEEQNKNEEKASKTIVKLLGQ